MPPPAAPSPARSPARSPAVGVPAVGTSSLDTPAAGSPGSARPDGSPPPLPGPPLPGPLWPGPLWPGPLWPARLENAAALGRMIFVCEHASNAFPDPFGALGLTPQQQTAHIAWDPGALGLARALAHSLGGVLVAGEVSRLIYDCNRPPDAPGAIAAQSEIHAIPGNTGLSGAQRLARVAAVYEPFHATLRGEILRRITLGPAPVIVTIHSFTPTFHGAARSVELGVIHDADATLARAVVQAAQALPLQTRLNEPYSAADQVTHTLRLHATPYGLPSVMLEIRNDLIDTPRAEQAMADLLAPVLAQALATIEQSGAAAPIKTRTG